MLPAKERPEVDWETANRIAEDNPDFRDFVASVANSIKVNQIVTTEFDSVLADKALLEHTKKLSIKKAENSQTTEEPLNN